MSSIKCDAFLKSLIEQGWRQVDLAELLEVKQPQICRLCKGSKPSIDVVVKLAEHYNVTTDEILGRIEKGKKASC